MKDGWLSPVSSGYYQNNLCVKVTHIIHIFNCNCEQLIKLIRNGAKSPI